MKRRIMIPIVLLVIIAAAAWYIYGRAKPASSADLQASGTVEGMEVTVAAETGGRVVEVLVDEGDPVQPGDVLFRLDDAILQGQRRAAQAALDSANAALEISRNGEDLAQAALDTANANIETARAAQDTAGIQADSVLATALHAEQAANQSEWQTSQPSEFNQPAWYFQKSEELDAARLELEMAQQDLNEAQGDLAGLMNSDSGKELSAAEENLNRVRIAFEVAQEVLDRARAQTDQNIIDAAQKVYDTAKEALDSAQSEYDRLFTGDFVDTVLNARAKVSVAQSVRDIAQDWVIRLQTGYESLQVQAAQSAARQAGAAVAVAEANAAQAETALEAARLKVDQSSRAVDQAQANLDLIDIQIAKLEVKTQVAGVITSRSVEPGEVLTPGGSAMVIGELDRLTITVYLPEDRYGSVGVGSQASVTVDSFPDQSFEATVIRIADQAEFTPRNVSTQEGRTTTVFSVGLKVDNPERMLKPGMPADVSFNP